MSYIETNLRKDESIIRIGQLHWLLWVGPIFWGLLSLLFLLPGLATGKAEPIALGLGFAIGAGYGLLRLTLTEFGATDRRVMHRHGVLFKHVEELGLEKVEEVTVKQGPIGQMLGYGTVLIKGTGIGGLKLKYIKDPIAFRNALQDARESRSGTKA